MLPLLFLLPALALAARPKDAIKLSDVQTLTLRGKGQMTNHRRVDAIPQLHCNSRKAICDLYEVDVMRCTNQGSSWGDEDIQWSCVADLPEEFRLGSTDVICEGYSSPDDPYVLKGSCGVEYQIALTRKGERRYPGLARSGNINFVPFLFTIIFVGILGWIIYSACIRARRRGGNIFRNDRGGWQPSPRPVPSPSPSPSPPGGDDDNNDPPPPYPGTKPSGNGDRKPGPSGNDSSKPGFWSGAVAGGGVGYFFGRSNNRNNSSPLGYGTISHDRLWHDGSSYGPGQGRTHHGSTDHGHNRLWDDRIHHGSTDHGHNRLWDDRTHHGSTLWPGRSSCGPGSSAGSDGSTHKSTGFGTTSRR